MRLLDRYLFRELLIPLGFCLGGFLVFWIAFDIFGRLDDFQDWKFSLADVVQYYWLGLPELLNTALPVALLLAMLYALTTHSRHNELIAMRAAGLSLWRICVPYFALGLVLSVALLLINENLMVDAADRKEELARRYQQVDLDAAGKWRERVNFWNPATQRDWSIAAFQPDTAELRQVRVGMFLPEGVFREVIADTAQWTNGYWRLTNGLEKIFRTEDDPLPGELPKGWFTLEEMGGTPETVIHWPGTSLMESNQVVALTNVARRHEESGSRWTADSFVLTNELFTGFRFSAPLSVGARRVVIAESGLWTNGQWRFLDTREFLYRSATDGDPMYVHHPELDLPEFDETPDMIRSEVRVSDLLTRNRAMRRPELPVRDVLEYLKLHPHLAGPDRALLETQLHARMAAPWTCLVVSVIAIPFGAPSGRRNIFYGVAGSLALGFLYFSVQRLGFALGQSGLIPAWIGGWLPNLGFGVIGIWLTARVR